METSNITITWKAIVAAFVCLGLTIIAVMALKGNLPAIIIVIVLGSVLLVALGAGIVILATGQAAAAEERRFQKNMLQDLRMMQQLARAQSLQNRGLMQQLGRPQLPAAAGSLLFDDSIFGGLDEEPVDTEWRVGQ